MSGYDAKAFTKQFSERTNKNLSFIKAVVKSDEVIENQILSTMNGVVKDIENLANSLLNDVKEIKAAKKKGKDEEIKKLYSMSNRIRESAKMIDYGRTRIEVKERKLFEVTQLINSLLGIVVVPYEMHKEYFNDSTYEDEYRNNVIDTDQYKELYKYIVELRKKGKWKTTYKSDNNNDEENPVFEFLRHLRNSVCHSGNGALILLPLDEGEIINEVLFYDRYVDKKSDNVYQFAMDLNLSELNDLIDKITDFYQYTEIGNVDKSQKLEEAESRIRNFLNS